MTSPETGFALCVFVMHEMKTNKKRYLAGVYQKAHALLAGVQLFVVTQCLSGSKQTNSNSFNIKRVESCVCLTKKKVSKFILHLPEA